MRKSTRFLGAIAVAGLIAGSGSAFTSANTVSAGKAGAGTSAIAAYTTSDLRYNANSTNPENLDSVRFTLNATARYVAMRTHSTGTWYRSDDLRLSTGTVNSCTSSDQLTWTCDVTGNSETISGADSLSVVATS